MGDKRMQVFNQMLIRNNKVAYSYNKRIERKSFEVGDLVLKIILLIDSNDRDFGKWFSNW